MRPELEKKQSEIIESQDVEQAYHFAMQYEREGADIRALGEMVLHHGDSLTLYFFSRDIAGADTSMLEAQFVELANVDEMIMFAQNVSNANILVLEQAMVKRADICPFDAYTFANTSSKNAYATETKFFENIVTQGCDANAAYYFAKNCKGADLKALEKVVLEYGDPSIAYDFALNIPDANVKALGTLVAQGMDSQIAYEFARDVKDADIAALENCIIRNDDNPTAAYSFARDVGGANIEKLKNMVMDCKHDETINAWKDNIEEPNSDSECSEFGMGMS